MQGYERVFGGEPAGADRVVVSSQARTAMEAAGVTWENTPRATESAKEVGSLSLSTYGTLADAINPSASDRRQLAEEHKWMNRDSDYC